MATDNITVGQIGEYICASVLLKLGMEDKMDEICQSVLGDQHKIKQQKDPNKPKRTEAVVVSGGDEQDDWI